MPGQHSITVCSSLWEHGERGTKTNNLLISVLLYKSRLVVPLPERSLGLFDTPPVEQPPLGKASHDEMAIMQECCKTYDASVRQRSVRQETTITMAKAGTLPDCLYQKDVTVIDKIIFTSDSATADPVTTNAITEVDAEDSSTPEPVEPNSGEPEGNRASI